jgi:hypothetical protein
MMQTKGTPDLFKARRAHYGYLKHSHPPILQPKIARVQEQNKETALTQEQNKETTLTQAAQNKTTQTASRGRKKIRQCNHWNNRWIAMKEVVS